MLKTIIITYFIVLLFLVLLEEPEDRSQTITYIFWPVALIIGLCRLYHLLWRMR